MLKTANLITALLNIRGVTVCTQLTSRQSLSTTDVSTFIHQLRTCYTRPHLSTNSARATHNTPQLTQHALPARAGSGSNPIGPSTQEPAQLIRPTRPAKCVSCPAILTATLLVPTQSLYIPAGHRYTLSLYIPACHRSTLAHYIPACPRSTLAHYIPA